MLSSFCVWLDTALSGFDYALLSVLHGAAEAAGVVLTPIARLITLLGEKGIVFFAAALVLACFPRTRKTAVCLFGAVCCGALITNICLKEAVCRLRPFEAIGLYAEWWEAVGAPAESGFSFPSGHVTAAAAGMFALCFARGWRWLWAALPTVAVMACSRCYLMAHYPSDVLAAAVIGVLSAAVAWGITCLIYAVLERTADKPFSRFVLTFDPRRPGR